MKDNIRSRQLIFLFVLISVMVSTIAYAGLSTSLAITSEAKLKAIADIRVNDIKYKESNNGGRQEYEPEYDVKEVKVGVVLPNASSNVIYKVEIINSGDIDQIIKEITVSNPNVNVEINGITIGNAENENIIEAKSTREIEIKITPKTPSNEVQNVVITFNFKKIYKITYDANGGENAPSSQNKIEDEDIMLTNEKPTKEGYDFDNWNTKTDGSGTSYPDAQTGMIYKTNANLDLYAQWKVNIYTIILNNQSATTTGTTTIYEKYNTGYYLDSELTKQMSTSSNAITLPTKTGYTFGGYYTSTNGGGTQYIDANGKLTLNASITNFNANGTLYAKWTVNKYTVTANANGGNISSTSGWTGTGNTSTKQVTYDSTYGTLPSVSRTGYTFEGWNGKNLFDGLFKLGAITIGSNNNYTDIDINRNLNYSDLNSLFYTFGGYFTAGTYTFSVNSSDHWYSLNRIAIAGTNCVSATLSLRNSYTWTQSVDGYTYFSIERDAAINNYTDTDFDGHDFKLQIEEGSIATPYEPYYVTSSTKVTQSKDHTLTAVWQANTYTVTYNGNGATGGSTATSTHTYDVAKNLTTNGYTKTGYTFAGWNTKADGTGTAYLNEASVNNLTSTNNGNVTLYAQWIGNTYTVTYNGNGNTGGSTAQSSHIYGTEKALTTNGFTKTGYTFTGWSTSASDKNLVYDNTEYHQDATSTSNSYIDLKRYNVAAPFTAGEVYQLEFDAKGTGKLTSYFYGADNYLRVANVTNSDGWSGTSIDGTNWVNLTSSYKHYSVRFVLGSTGDGSITKIALLRAIKGNDCYAKNIRFFKVSSSSTAYSDGQTVKNLATSGNVNLYAIWEKKEATFLSGSSVNAKFKKLADNTATSYTTANTNVTSIQRANTLPSSWIVNDEVTPPSDNNIVSTSDSKYPIYAWFDNGTIYYYTEALNPYTYTSIEAMFYNFKSLESIDLSSINTTKTTNMRDVFNNCISLKEIDLSDFNTISVNNMWGMFINCRSLKKIKFGNYFNTSNVIYMYAIFENCTSIENLDLSTFDMSSVTNVTDMLNGMTSLKQLKTPKVMPNKPITLPKLMIDSNDNEYTTIDSNSPTSTWLYNPSTFIDGQSFNAKIKQLAGNNEATYLTEDRNITSIQRYTNTPSSSTLENAEVVSTNDSYKPIYAWYDNGIIYYYSESTNLYTNVNASYMFNRLLNITNIDLSTIDTSITTNMSAMFFNCQTLPSIDVSNFDTTKVTNLYAMFQSCSSMRTIDISNFNTPNLTNTMSMFAFDINLENVIFGTNFDTSNVSTMAAMFIRCYKIEILDLSKINMTAVTNTNSMLSEMTSLKQLKTPNTYSSDTTKTITLPTTLYDASGNSYTTLTSTSPISTWLKTEYVPYSITYDLDGGTLSTPNPTTYNINSSNITLNNPTKTGYTFKGWSSGKNLVKPLSQQTTIDGITITPQSDGSVILNGSKTSPYSSTILITSGFEVKANTQYIVSIGNYDSNLINYGLSGFGTGKSINHPVDFTSAGIQLYISEDTVISNLRLYPQIEEGSSATSYEPYIDKQTNVTIPSGSTGNRTYKAKWTANTYTVTYNGNGNTGGSTATSTHTYDVAKNLTTNGYTKTGYTFAGWNTKADGTGTAYTDGQSVTNLLTSGNLDLYAQWIDDIAPTNIQITNSSNGNWTNQNVTVTISATEAGSGIKEFEWYESGAWTTRSLTTDKTNNTGTITYTEEGSQNIRFRAVDNVGNISDEKTTTVKIDKTKPTIEANNITYGSSLSATLKDTASGVSYYQITTTATEPTSGWTEITNSTNTTISKAGLTVGTYYIWAKDEAGNISTGKEVKVTKQKVGTITNLKVNEAGIVTWDSVSNATGYQISIDGTNWVAVPKTANTGYDYLNTITSVTGERTVYVRAVNIDDDNYETSDIASISKTVLKVTINVNNTNYGTVDTSTINVISGVTYTTSSNVLTIKAGTTTLNTITATKIDQTGYTTTFSNWSSASGTISANTTLTANFTRTANTYTVTANANGGSIASTTGWTGTGETSTKQVTYDSAYGTLPSVSRTGYTFKGWSLLPNGYKQVEYIESEKNGEYINTQYMPIASTKIYLDFQFIESGYSSAVPIVGERTSNASTTKFVIWVNNASGQLEAINYGSFDSGYISNTDSKVRNIVSNDKGNLQYNGNVVAHQSKNTTFTNSSTSIYLFGLNTGSSLDARQLKARVYSFKIYEGTEIKRNYVPCINESTGKAGLYDLVEGKFYGNSGTGDFTVPTDETFVTSTTVVKTAGNHNIYAKWDIDTYNITYDLRDGSVSTANPTSYNIETTTFTLNNPTRSGYTFDGWTGSNGTTPQTSVSIAKGSTGDKTYTANWSKAASNLTVSLSQDSYTYDGTAKTPTVTVKDGSTTIPASEYDVTYSNNINAGTATVTVTMKGTYNSTTKATYTGNTTKTFTINKKTLTITAENKSMTYGGSAPSYTYTSSGAISGESPISGTATYTIKSGSTTISNVSTANVGSYSIVPSGLTIGSNYTANYVNGTLTISKLTATASNVQVSTSGIVTWTGSNATGYQISIDGTNWTNTLESDKSGYNYLNTITAVTGSRTVYVKAVNSDTTNYNNQSTAATKAVNVYRVTAAVNNADYGTVNNTSANGYNVIEGMTYSTSGNVLTFSIGATSTARTIDLAGYTTTFTGWSSTSGTITANTIITANFTRTANNYTLTANANGGSIASTTGWTGTGNTSTKSVTYDSAYGTLPSVSRTGYTFKGWSLVPEGYTPVEYIQSTGTQYIDTGLVPNKDYRIEMKVNPQEQNGGAMFGAFYTDDTDYRLFYVNNSLYFDNNTGRINPTVSNLLNTTFTVEIGNYYIIKDGLLISSGNTVTNQPDQSINIYIFGMYAKHGSGLNLTKIKVYSFKVWNPDGSLSRDMIPCINESTGKAGLYDLVEGKFYGNAATSGDDFTVPEDEYFIDSTSIVNIPSNHNIYAKWTPVTYNLTYDLRNGSVATANPTSYNIETTTFSLNNPTRSGYTFSGWTGSNGTTPQTSVSIAKGTTGDKSFTANWSKAASNLTVTLGTTSYTYDGTAKTPTVTVKDGSTTIPASEYDVTYTNNTNAGTASVKVTMKGNYYSTTKATYTGNTTKTFTINKKTLTITAENKSMSYGGSAPSYTYTSSGAISGESPISGTATYTIKSGSTTISNVSTANAGSYTIVPSGLTIGSNYTANYVNGTLTVNKVAATASNVQVSTAGIVTWTGSNATGYQISIDGTNWTNTLESDKSGYNYLNTITAATGSRTVYVKALNSDTTNYNNQSTAATKAVTVVTLTTSSNNSNYGTVNASSTKVISGATYSTSSNVLTLVDGRKVTATKIDLAGYTTTFSSWSSASGTITANTAITANFTRTANSYTVTANANGGSIASTTGWTGTGNTSTKSVTYDSTYGTLPSVSRAGYTLKGWTENMFDIDDMMKTYKPYQTVASEKTTFDNQEVWKMNGLINETGRALKYMQGEFKENTQYTIYTNVYQQNENNNICGVIGVVCYNSDCTDYSYITSMNVNSWNETTVVTPTGKSISYIRFTYGTGAANTYIKDFVIKEGVEITPASTDYMTSSTIVKTADNHDIYAQWLPHILTVKIHSNGAIKNSSGTMVDDILSTENLSYDGTVGYNWPTDYQDPYGFKLIRPGYNVEGKYHIGSPSSTNTISQDLVKETTPVSTIAESLGVLSELNAGDTTVDLYPGWVEKTYTLTVKPNGGSYNSKTTDTSYTLKYSDVQNIVNPTREGYTFNGWNELIGAYSNGLASITKYTNANSSVLTVETQAKSSDNPISAMGNEVKITHSGAAATSPGLGGFRHSQVCAANKVYTHVFVAKLPSGYYYHNANNSLGTGATTSWLTTNEGTGKWQTYIYQVNCGTGGSFADFGYVYVSKNSRNYWERATGEAEAITSYLAYSNIYDITSNQNGIGQYDGTGVLTANWTANELTFNNKTLSAGTYGTAYTSGAFTSASNGTGSYTYSIKSGAPTGATINSTNRTISFTNSTAAGTYNVVVTATDNNSGVTKDATMSITINRQSIAFPTCSAKTYTGSEQTLFDAHTSGSYKNSVLKGTNATTSTNTYTVNLTPTANYQWSTGSNVTSARTLTCTINPKQLDQSKFTVSNNSKTYDGNTNVKSGFALTANTTSGLVSGDSVTVSYTSAAYNVKTTSATTINVSGISINNSNYSLKAASQGYTGSITAKALTPTVSASNKTYDGTTSATCSSSVTLSGVVSGDTVTASANTSGTFDNKNVGTGKTVTCSGITLAGTDKGNYSVASSKTTTANITAKTLTITAENKSMSYGGSAPSYTYTSSGAISGESPISGTATYTIKSGSTTISNVSTANAGSYSIVPSGLTIGSNYTANYVNGTLTINKVAATITCSNKTYNGSEQTACSCSGGTIGGEYKATNYRSTAYTATCTGDANHTDATSKTWTMSKKAVTVTAGSSSRAWNGSALTNSTCTGSGLVSGHTVTCSMTSGSTITTAGSVDNEINTTTIKSGSTDVTSNYNVTTAKGTLTVTLATPTLSLTAKSSAYTGSAISANAVSASPDAGGSKSYTYYSSTDCSGTALSGAPTNAGEYSVKATVAAVTNKTNANSICKTHTITRSETTTSLSEITKTYNGNAQAASGASAKLNSNNSAISGATFTYKFYTNSACSTGETSNPPRNAGTYYVKASVTGTSNYDTSTSSCTKYTMSKKAVTYKATDQSKIYDGNALNAGSTCTLTSGSLVSGHSATCTCTGSQTAVGGSVKTLSSVVIKNGSTDVSANYDITKENGALYVNNAKITFNANGGTISGTNPVYSRAGATSVYTGIRNTTTATIPTATRSSYALEGWYTSASGGSKVLNANKTFTGTTISGYTNGSSWNMTSNITLYAHWIKAKKIYSIPESTTITNAGLSINSPSTGNLELYSNGAGGHSAAVVLEPGDMINYSAAIGQFGSCELYISGVENSSVVSSSASGATGLNTYTNTGTSSQIARLTLSSGGSATSTCRASMFDKNSNRYGLTESLIKTPTRIVKQTFSTGSTSLAFSNDEKMISLAAASGAIVLQVPIKKNDTITITKVASGTGSFTVEGATSCTLTSANPTCTYTNTNTSSYTETVSIKLQGTGMAGNITLTNSSGSSYVLLKED